MPPIFRNAPFDYPNDPAERCRTIECERGEIERAAHYLHVAVRDQCRAGKRDGAAAGLVHVQIAEGGLPPRRRWSGAAPVERDAVVLVQCRFAAPSVVQSPRTRMSARPGAGEVGETPLLTTRLKNWFVPEASNAFAVAGRRTRSCRAVALKVPEFLKSAEDAERAARLRGGRAGSGDEIAGVHRAAGLVERRPGLEV